MARKGFTVVIADEAGKSPRPTFKSEASAVSFARSYAKLGHATQVVRNKTGTIVAMFSKE